MIFCAYFVFPSNMYLSSVPVQKKIYRTVRSHRSAALNHTTAPPPRLSTYSKLRAAFSRNTRRAWLGLDGVSSLRG